MDAPMSPLELAEGKYSFDDKRHCHSIDGKPLLGTTSVLGILNKPGLTYWASGLCANALGGWLNPKKNSPDDVKKSALDGLGKIITEFGEDYKNENPKNWIKFLDQCYKAFNTFKEKRADIGTDLHAMAEQFIKAKIKDENATIAVPSEIEPFVEWSLKNVKRFLFSELHCYSELLWVGGIADFGYVDMQGRTVLGDFKSSKDVYFSHPIQCGAYDCQISENGLFDDKGNQVLPPLQFNHYTIFLLGGDLKEPVMFQDTMAYRKAFLNALEIYKLQQVFDGK